MLKAVIFDFDGVILESFDIKTRAFKTIFKDYPDSVLKIIVEYHTKNGGLSRLKKIRYIYKHILKEKLTQKDFKTKCSQFNKASFQFLIKCPFVKDIYNFIVSNYKKYDFHIASGAPQEEIRLIAKKRGIRKYFKGIYGSPASKVELVSKIVKMNKLNPKNVVFVGDALNDLAAARKNKISAIIRLTNYNRKYFRNTAAIRLPKFELSRF